MAGFIADFDLHEPAGLVWILGKSFQIVDQIGIDVGNLAVNGAHQIAYRLDRLDFAEGLAGADLAADLGQRHEDQIGQDLDGESGDSDGGDFSRRGRAGCRPIRAFWYTAVAADSLVVSFLIAVVKWKRYDPGAGKMTANVDLEFPARVGKFGRNIAHRNRFLQGGRKGSAGDLAHCAASRRGWDNLAWARAARTIPGRCGSDRSGSFSIFNKASRPGKS